MDPKLIEMMNVETVKLTAEEETAFEAALDIYRDEMEGEEEMVEQVVAWRDLAASAFVADVDKIPSTFSPAKRLEALGTLARFHVYASAERWQATLEELDDYAQEREAEAA